MTKHATTSASRATALIVLVTACTRAPARTSRQSTMVKRMTTADATYADRPAIAGTSTPSDSASTIDTAAELPHVEIQSLQPTTNPAYSPMPARANTYCPPDRGSIAPSSASETAPSSAYTPPAIHSASTRPSLPAALAATSPGARRIPAQIVFPIVTASPNPTPRTRSRRPVGRARGAVMGDEGGARHAGAPPAPLAKARGYEAALRAGS